MSEKTPPASPIMAVQAKKVTSTKRKKPKSSSHPRTSEMVTAAIASLKERGGSSFQAIKKYITGTYNLDAEKQAPFIKKYLKTAVEQGELIQTKGKGASGSFKLGAAKAGIAKPKTPVKTKSPTRKSISSKKEKPAAKISSVKKAPKKKEVPAKAKKAAVAKKSPAKKAPPRKKEAPAKKTKTAKK